MSVACLWQRAFWLPTVRGLATGPWYMTLYPHRLSGSLYTGVKTDFQQTLGIQQGHSFSSNLHQAPFWSNLRTPCLGGVIKRRHETKRTYVGCSFEHTSALQRTSLPLVGRPRSQAWGSSFLSAN